MARFERGDEVRVKADLERVGMVRRVYEGEEEPRYEVFFSAHERPTYPERSLLPADVADAGGEPVELLKRWRLADAEEFRSFVTLSKLITPLADNVYSYLASRTQLLAYQFKPVLKLLDSPYPRILIADEVGLGKTIEAGIVLVELHARDALRSVLVTCPSALTDKWQGELGERFDWDFEIVDGTGLRDVLAASERNPARPLRVIASLELMRREENLQALQSSEPSLDLVIVDEAHHMRNQGTMTNQLGEMLSGYADTLVFLTATPLNLGNSDFFELLSLLVPEEFNDFADFEYQIAPNEQINAALRELRATEPDFSAALVNLQDVQGGRRLERDPRYSEVAAALDAAAQAGVEDRGAVVRLQRRVAELNTLSHVFTRTKKREVSRLFPLRRAGWIPVRFTREEQEFYDAVSDWVQHATQRYGVGIGAFVTIMFQRQVASCVPAMGEKLEETVLQSAIVYEWDEVEEALGPGELNDVGTEADGSASIVLQAEERDTLGRLRAAWLSTRGIDSKFDEFATALRQLVDQGARKIMVFSFFRKTIEYLERRLNALDMGSHDLHVLKLYGPVPSNERSDVVNAFREIEAPTVLLSSEVGSEGLDFQFCSAMINYDLPWNPMRVEQRIGRLDRFGQMAESIDILNLVAEDTVEDRMFARLYERIGIFERSIGDLEAILGEELIADELRSLQRDIAHGTLTRDEEERRAQLVADAILRTQQENEEFDEQSRKFLGHDEVFRDRFHDIEAGQRYISAGELRNIVERFLTREFSKATLRETDRPGVFELRGGAESGLGPFLTDWHTRNQESSRRDWRLIDRLVSNGGGRLTFSAEAASLDHTLEFISIQHPLVRAIVDFERQAEQLPTGRFRVSADGVPPGPRFFFLFRVSVGGMKRRLELVPVVVHPGEGIDDELSSSFFPRLADAQQSELAPDDFVTDEAVEAAAATARVHVDAQVDRSEAEAQRINDAAIDAQLESLGLGYERRRDRLERRLTDARNERIIRMYRGELANRERAFQRRSAELEAKRAVAASSELVAAGVIDVA